MKPKLQLALEENGIPPFDPAHGFAPETRSLCEIRPGIGLCDECSQPKWPQEYVGYGFMVCLDCLDTERKAQNDRTERPTTESL